MPPVHNIQWYAADPVVASTPSRCYSSVRSRPPVSQHQQQHMQKLTMLCSHPLDVTQPVLALLLLLLLLLCCFRLIVSPPCVTLSSADPSVAAAHADGTYSSTGMSRLTLTHATCPAAAAVGSLCPLSASSCPPQTHPLQQQLVQKHSKPCLPPASQV